MGGWGRGCKACLQITGEMAQFIYSFRESGPGGPCEVEMTRWVAKTGKTDVLSLSQGVRAIGFLFRKETKGILNLRKDKGILHSFI